MTGQKCLQTSRIQISFIMMPIIANSRTFLRPILSARAPYGTANKIARYTLSVKRGLGERVMAGRVRTGQDFEGFLPPVNIGHFTLNRLDLAITNPRRVLRAPAQVRGVPVFIVTITENLLEDSCCGRKAYVTSDAQDDEDGGCGQSGTPHTWMLTGLRDCTRQRRRWRLWW